MQYLSQQSNSSHYKPNNYRPDKIFKPCEKLKKNIQTKCEK